MISLALGPLGQQNHVFSPADISGLVAWYDASDAATLTTSGSQVTQWDDKSVNGYHLTRPAGATGPTTGTRTKNSLNVLDFLSQNLRSTAFVGTFTYTILAVFVQDTTPSSPFISTVVYWNGVNEDGLRVASGVPQQVNTNGGVAVAVGASTANGTWIMAAAEHRGSGQPLGLVKNGVTGTTPNSPGDKHPTNFFTVGRFYTGPRPLDGAIAEIAVYSPTISSGDRVEVETYFSTKWAI